MDDELIESLKATDAGYKAYLRAHDFQTNVPGDYPPAPPEVVTRAEQQLGFALPPLLKRLYTEVANGGFGPGLVGLEGGYADEEWPEDTLVGLYHGYREYAAHLMECEPEVGAEPWPERLLPVCSEGCAMMLCLDCSEPEMPVVRYDPHYHPWPRRFIRVHTSLRGMLEAWVKSFQ